MEELIKKSFPYPMPIVSANAHLLISYLNEELSELTKIDPDLNPSWLDSFLTAVTSADALPSDNLVKKWKAGKKLELDNNLKLSCEKFQFAKYFVQKTFVNHPIKINEFGYDLYAKSSRSPELMVALLNQFIMTAEEHKAELIASGYLQSYVDEIKQLKAALELSHTEYEKFKSKRTQYTQNRIKAYNLVWTYMTIACNVGKIAYADDPVKYQHYILIEKSTTEGGKGYGIIKGIVKDSLTLKPLQGAELLIKDTDYNDMSDSKGEFLIDEIASGDYILCTSLSGYTANEISVKVENDKETTIEINLIA